MTKLCNPPVLERSRPQTPCVHDTHPADLCRADKRLQAKIRADCHTDGKQREHHLPQR